MGGRHKTQRDGYKRNRCQTQCAMIHIVLCLTVRVSHDEERARGTRLEQRQDRSPRHWFHPLVRQFVHRSAGRTPTTITVLTGSSTQYVTA
jgi:hypothetical protein